MEPPSAAIAVDFVLQMAIGVVAGVAGGIALLWFMRRVTLPSEALYPLRTLASVLLLYGVTTLLHGSGFLAVFVAGIVIGGRRAPYQREIERFHAALAGLAEIVAFVGPGTHHRPESLGPDGCLAARTHPWRALSPSIIRPLVVGLCLLPAQLDRGERAFVLFAGLKGAVPILLGLLLLTADVPDAERLYGIVVIVVIFSVVVQGSLVPTVARRLGVPMQPIRPEPWTVGRPAAGRAGHCSPGQQLRQDLSSTAEPSRRSPSWRATSGSAWWYAMGRCCRCAATLDYELGTW